MLDNDWEDIIKEEMNQPYFKKLEQLLEQEREAYTIYPPHECLYQALKLTSYKDTRVVILGQDPYHGPGQAHGLSFSVMPGVRIPPSLRNIHKELASDLGYAIPNHGSLVHWAKNGVLLLNAVLTVREGQANSHKRLGWERFTDHIIKQLNEREQPVVFILWGNQAKAKGAYIDRNKHFIVESNHPSPLSAHRGFFGSRPFSEANEFLISSGQVPVDWVIPPLGE